MAPAAQWTMDVFILLYHGHLWSDGDVRLLLQDWYWHLHSSLDTGVLDAENPLQQPLLFTHTAQHIYAYCTGSCLLFCRFKALEFCSVDHLPQVVHKHLHFTDVDRFYFRFAS